MKRAMHIAFLTTPLELHNEVYSVDHFHGLAAGSMLYEFEKCEIWAEDDLDNTEVSTIEDARAFRYLPFQTAKLLHRDFDVIALFRLEGDPHTKMGCVPIPDCRLTPTKQISIFLRNGFFAPSIKMGMSTNDLSVVESQMDKLAIIFFCKIEYTSVLCENLKAHGLDIASTYQAMLSDIVIQPWRASDEIGYNARIAALYKKPQRDKLLHAISEACAYLEISVPNVDEENTDCR